MKAVEIKPKSKRGVLTTEGIRLVAQNALIFAAPALLVFLTVIQSGGGIKEASVALYTWGLNTFIDLLRKIVADY